MKLIVMSSDAQYFIIMIFCCYCYHAFNDFVSHVSDITFFFVIIYIKVINHNKMFLIALYKKEENITYDTRNVGSYLTFFFCVGLIFVSVV